VNLKFWHKAVEAAGLGFLCVALLGAVALPGAQAQNVVPVRTAAPSWVEPITPDLAAVAPAEQTSQGQYFLLADEQVRVDGKQRVVYRHYATRALTVQGLESLANLEIRFDPSYQELSLHQIAVWRAGQPINKLRSARVRVLQRETELETLIFDGSRTASVFLEDVRVGDVVEYAYSLRGHNPVFGQWQSGRFGLQWNVPIARVFARLVWPQGRALHVRPREGAAEPVRLDSPALPGTTEYRWDLREVAGRRVENDAPSWFDPYPVVEWSEFKNWSAVVKWALPLYRLPAQAPAAVQAEIERISAAHPPGESRLMAALNFVQREIRYLGVEVGAGSHAPSPPSTVLARRFGDCKDKALLTTALLRGLGIAADVALVNTSARHAIDGWQPGPYAFNHVVVRAKLGAQTWWIDPTRPPQAGPLSKITQAEHGLALVVAESSTALVPMAGESARLHRREMSVLFDASAGLDKPVQYTVTTVAEGPAAESLRASLSTQSRDKIESEYLNFYAGYFGDIKSVAPLKVTDDTAANRITVTEHYVTSKFWQRSEKKKRLEASIEVPDIFSHLRAPRTQVRNSPLFLSHPVELQHVTEVRLPRPWNVKPDAVHINEPAFELKREETWAGSTLRLTDLYRSRVNHLEATAVARYATGLEEARRALSYALYDHPDGGPAAEAGGWHWVPAWAVFFSVLGFGWCGWRAYRWNPAPAPPAAWPVDPQPQLTGLRGWLVLVPVALVLSIYQLLKALAPAGEAMGAASWQVLTAASSAAYHPLWAPALLLGLIGNVALLAGALLLLWLFFRRRSSLPLGLMVFFWGAVVLTTLDLALAAAIPAAAEALGRQEVLDSVRAFFLASCWTAYLKKSRRVKLTFVRRWPAVGAASVPPAPAINTNREPVSGR
jgi:transglutaminase-like putative cysteine protease